MSGWLFLGIVALISIGVFFNGLRFSRMSDDRLGGVQLEIPSFLANGRTPAEQTRLVGRISMVVAPLLLLLFAALCFGLFGPVDGIETIKLTSGA